MKAGLLTIAALSALAVAQPLQRELPAVVKRDVVQVTQTTVVTETAPAVIVYVDQDGHPISDANAAPVQHYQRPEHNGPQDHTQSTSTTTPVAAPPPPAATTATTTDTPPAPATTSTTVAQINPTLVPQAIPSPAPATSSVVSSGLGITYSPYTSGPCKSADDIAADFAELQDYPLIRIYGTDCNQIENVLAAMNKGSTKQQLMVGMDNVMNIAAEISLVDSQVKGNWDLIHTISVGNERVDTKSQTADEMLGHVNVARAGLRSIGWTGPVVTVDTVAAYLDNPELCGAADSASEQGAVYANAHAFFGGVPAASAGSFIQSQIDLLKEKCNNRAVVITETGWPSASALGMTVNLAVPSLDNQATAISSIKALFNNNLFLFSAYNEQWKPTNTGTFGVEKYWGVLGNSKFN